MTTRCLSKLQGWFWIMWSTSGRLSKTKSTLWSPSRLSLKPLVDRQSCLKVLATASISRNRGVRKYAASIYSPVWWLVLIMKHFCSFSYRDRLFQLAARSSMIEKNNKRKWMRIRESTVSLDPRRKKTTSLRITLGVSREERREDKTKWETKQTSNREKKTNSPYSRKGQTHLLSRKGENLKKSTW